MKRNAATALACTCLAGLLAITPVTAATLSSAELSSGASNLSLGTQLGDPGQIPGFWFIELVDWVNTGEVTIELGVSSPDGDSELPVLYNVLLNATNSTTDVWDQFELEVSGPATFSIASPTTINQPADPPSFSPTLIRFTGMQLLPTATATVTFGLDVIPPGIDDPLLLTLRPVVPEPSTGLLIAVGAALVARRRRNV